MSVRTGASAMKAARRLSHWAGLSPIRKGIANEPLMEGLTSTGLPRSSAAISCSRNTGFSRVASFFVSSLMLFPHPKIRNN